MPRADSHPRPVSPTSANFSPRSVGLGLALRLYLLLVAICLPSFFLFYTYNLRMMDNLHTREVGDISRVVALRIEDWLAAFPAASGREAPPLVFRGPGDSSDEAELRKCADAMKRRCDDYGYRDVQASVDALNVLLMVRGPAPGDMGQIVRSFASFPAQKVELVLAYPMTEQEAELYAKPKSADELDRAKAPRGAKWRRVYSLAGSDPGFVVVRDGGFPQSALSRLQGSQEEGRWFELEPETARKMLAQRPSTMTAFFYLAADGVVVSSLLDIDDSAVVKKEKNAAYKIPANENGPWLHAIIANPMPFALTPKDDPFNDRLFFEFYGKIGTQLSKEKVYALYLEAIKAHQAGELARELKRIIDEPSGIVGVSIFVVAGQGSLQQIAAIGSARATPTAEDIEAVRGQPLSIDVMSDGILYKAVSVPLSDAQGVHEVIHLTLRPDTIGLGPRIPELRRSLIVGAIGMMIVIGLVVFVFFRMAVGRHVSRLISTMTRAAEGDLSALVDIHSGELGMLAGSYNQMMRRLKGSVDENQRLLEQIRRFNEELRQKVDAATKEVGEKNQQLHSVNERLFAVQRQMTTLEKLATLGQIATIIAHELGTPLNAISSHLQLLLEETVSDPNVLTRLKAIDAQVDRLTGIVRNVLKAMRVPPPNYGRVDLQRLLVDVVELCSPMAQKRGVKVDVASADGVPSIVADPDQLQQVFMNLFTNAMDAMGKGGELKISAQYVSADVARQLAQESWLALDEVAHIRIDVRDNGEGMDEETATRIFEPFYSTKRPESEHAGTGLGLSICRQIVKNHRGEITVKSAKGEGTTFTLYLPVEPAKAAVER